jgi:hypothetical protein
MIEPLKFHPLADIFPLMEGTEFDELVADIKANGLNELITRFQDMVLDGRNRARACAAAGVTPRYHEFKGNEADARAYVVSANIKRRHLSANQKRDLLVKIVAAQPEKSDRQIGKQTGVDHKTIAKARKKGESTGDVSPVKKRKGADGKTRRQPAKKKTRGAGAAAGGAAAGGAAAGGAAASSGSQRSGTKALEEQIATDRKYARYLVKQYRDAAQWLRAILINEKRRGAVADALIRALKNTESSAPKNTNGSDGNDADPVASGEAVMALHAAADGGVAK